MKSVATGYVDNEETLEAVLSMCYEILGEWLRDVENYRVADWERRMREIPRLLVYAHDEGMPVAAVLGRHESKDSLILGFVACREKYRKRGVTSRLLQILEHNAIEIGYKYVTLGADDSAVLFYEKCGYNRIDRVHDQAVYQKVLQSGSTQ